MTVPPPSAVPASLARRGARALGLALALSLLVHALVTLWPVASDDPPPSTLLTATLTEMPPPPAAEPPPPAAPKARPKPRPRPVSPLLPPPPAPVEPEPADETVALAEAGADAPGPPEPTGPPEPSGPPAPPVLAETVDRAAPAAPARKALPARVDLAYRVYFGPGLYIGDASYRFTHAANRYAISTLGEARGLAALVLRGQGKIEARGLITPEGLQPWELAVERGSRNRREVASFDWDVGIATLHEQKTAALELPSYDPLSLMWQFYFAPPEHAERVFHIVTTRRVTRVTIRREGVDTIEWPHGEVEAERWHRTSDDGQSEAIFWLAPSLRYLPVKMRVSNTTRGTLDVVLASIRVDDGERVE